MQKLARVTPASILLAVSASWWSGCSNDISVPDVDTDDTELTGAVMIRTTTWGRWADADGYVVSIDGDLGPTINPYDSVTIDELDVGRHEVELTRIGNYCVVQGSNPRVLSVGLGTTPTSFRVDCTGPALTLALVSGHDQAARPGEPLAEPLVVQVTDSSGVGIADVEVDWMITAGDATLASGFQPGAAGPVLEASTRTDADGLARAHLMPLGFEIIEVTAHSYDLGGSPVTFQVDATDPGATLEVMSGTGQPAQAGRELDAPFVVRVSDSRGEPTPYVRVTWQVESGDGDFGRDELGGRVRSDTIRTDPDGTALVSLTPTWFGPVEVSASMVGVEGSPAAFTADAADPGAALSVVSGDGQDGKTGEPLDEPFAVMATDGLGNPAANVRVTWTVVQGGGGFLEDADPDDPWDWYSSGTEEASGYTNAEGLAQVRFAPRTLGAVSANVELGGASATTTFTLDVNVLVIDYSMAWLLGPIFDDATCRVDPYGGQCFPDPGCTNCLGSVPLGTTIEWVNHLARAQIVSTSHPSNGTGFSSPVLGQGDRFQFVPAVVGGWEYVDQVLGTPGTLTVY
jgi:hypothetical protein